MNSIWIETSTLPAFGSLDRDIKTDVLIIGGGLAGILCAYFLDQAGISYALVEAQGICSGITKNTTAKITSQHGLIYDKLISRFGTEKAKMYFESNEAAVKKFRDLCGNIDCNFEEKAAYVYSLGDRRKIEKEITALERLGYDAEYADKLPLPFSVHSAISLSPVKLSSGSVQDKSHHRQRQPHQAPQSI